MATSPCVKCRRSLVVSGAPNAILLSWFNIVKSGDEKSSCIEIIRHHTIVIALIRGTLLELVEGDKPHLSQSNVFDLLESVSLHRNFL